MSTSLGGSKSLRDLRCLFVLLFFFESGLVVSPSGTWGQSTEVRTGRLWGWSPMDADDGNS